jgi:hypothetical protein
MPTPYTKLYEYLLPKFKDYELPLLTKGDIENLLQDYISPAIVQFNTCSKNLYNRDDKEKQFAEDLTEKEIQIISNYMLISYVHANYIVTPTLLKVNASSTDFNTFSSANHLDKLLALHNQMLTENEGLLSRYSWYKSNSEAIIKLKSGYNKKS